MAELAGAFEDQIRRLGRWNNQLMENCYLTCLPREAIRTPAGFPPAQGSFFIHRAVVEPPEALKLMVFPHVERSIQKIREGCLQETIAARGFLELLNRMRTVILQDSVLLKVEYPDHPLWNEMFGSNLYRDFTERLHQAICTSCDPTETRLQQAMPALSQNVDAMHLDLKSAIVSNLDPVGQTLMALKTKVNDLLSGKVPISINADWARACPPLIQLTDRLRLTPFLQMFS